MENIMKLDQQYVAHTYGRFPLQLERGEGSFVYDETGKRYIDLGSGIAVNIFGVADPAWQTAVTAQLGQLQHTSNLYYSQPCARLAELLCTRTGMEKVFFSNSGAEANECAIKAARRRAFCKYGDASHSTIITLKNSFHGRTIATLSATGQDVFHQEFGPYTPGFVYADANDAAALAALVEQENCCAIMMETVQGEGGVNVLEDAFVKEAQRLCREHDLLLIFDEVQTGNGRTGKLYSYMHYGVEADIVTTAKGLAGGLPMGATLFGARAAGIYEPGTHGSTFGGNPVCAAGALSILERIDDALMEDVLKKETRIRAALEHVPGVKEITGRGLMLGILCDKPAKEIVAAAMEQGLLIITAKDKVRLLPALNIPDKVLDEALEILAEVIRK